MKVKRIHELDRLSDRKVFHVIGCHPHFAGLWTQKTELALRESLKYQRVVAVGECGLDFSSK